MGYVLISDINITSVDDMKELFENFRTYTTKKKYYFDMRCKFQLSEKTSILNKFSISNYDTIFNENIILNFVDELFKNKESILELTEYTDNSRYSHYYHGNFVQLTTLKVEKSINLIQKLKEAQSIIPSIENINNLIDIIPYGKKISFANLSIEKLGKNAFALYSPFFRLYFTSLPQMFYKFMTLDPKINYKIRKLKIEAIQNL